MLHGAIEEAHTSQSYLNWMLLSEVVESNLLTKI